MSIEVKKSDQFLDGYKRSRTYLFYLSSMVLIALSLYAYKILWGEPFIKYNLIIFGNLFLIVVVFLYWYLQVKPHNFYSLESTFLRKKDDYKSKLNDIREIEDAIKLYDIELSNDKEIVDYINERLSGFPFKQDFRNFDRKVLSDSTRLSLFKNTLLSYKNSLILLQESIDEDNSSKSQEESDKDKSTYRMIKLIDVVTSRLKSEVEHLTKRANIYIIFGSVITLIAGFVLYLTVQDLLQVYNSITNSGSSFSAFDIVSIAIRFSIVIFIEVFAYYYLKLYRNIMDNIKYYQNEITNIEMKILSLHAIENSDCTESLKLLIGELSKTERNFVIDKNKTTIDLERSKLDSAFMKSSTDNVVKIIRSIKP